MDRIDEQILGLLRENARRSFSELGRQVGLSTNATAARVRRLETEGVILGYTILAGQDVPGPRGGLEVFIDVRLDTETDYDTFTTLIETDRQIVDAIHMTGPYDYLLRAYVPDTRALDLLLRRLKKECGAAQTQTRVALRAL
ncbi:Lrp/AsnC family transcriptional regulator [Mycolicibacterium fluoranthenivorans]|jgi:Lrp/AsnC family leucine-responsive transcriptional regulator|uniref:Lrp/AsnC family transcriptional regulator, leucine-responsive regulatory protein n=1 Tax=Mycolicibacterium fluoranthenivorans TaxID=258505 RepID=A0A1G4VNW4_9MYCO|nr:Lrp/AsnC family transcriptional regulator [Mycolicibacterium fluoranthenivorans]SCX08890.1 Lrp/AsnC family transcriptional regulator, leucine-responsive regulatory protein [Mycolicibacterium fluoranthenivorans]